MLNRLLIVFTITLLLFVGLPLSVFVFVVLVPDAISIEKLANQSTIQVLVTDRDTKQPIPDAFVKIETRYPSYCPGIMQNYRSKSRGYWLKTDNKGVASIPMKYFLIKGFRYNSRFLFFFQGTRIADLPSHAIIAAEGEDYVRDRLEFGKGIGKFLQFADQDMLPEIRLRKKATINTTRGSLSNSDRNFVDGKEPSSRTELFFKIDAKKKCVVKVPVKEEADFVIKYKKVAQTDIGDLDPDLIAWTDDDTVRKMLWCIDALELGGVATDPNAPNHVKQLGEVSNLNFQPSLALQKNNQRVSRVIVVRSKDGQRYAAVQVGPRQIWWVYPKGESVFCHARGYTGPFHPNFFVKGCRQYSPTTAPDFTHWD